MVVVFIWLVIEGGTVEFLYVEIELYFEVMLVGTESVCDVMVLFDLPVIDAVGTLFVEFSLIEDVGLSGMSVAGRDTIDLDSNMVLLLVVEFVVADSIEDDERLTTPREMGADVETSAPKTSWLLKLLLDVVDVVAVVDILEVFR